MAPEGEGRLPERFSSDRGDRALTGAWWIHRANLWGARLVGAIGFLVAFGLVVAAAYATAAMLSAAIGGFAADFAIVVAILLTVVCAGIVAPMMQIASRIVATLARHMGLGLSDLEGALLTSVKASRRPGQGISSEYCRHGLFELLPNSAGWLFHSRIYNHPKAIEKIAAWVMQAATSDVPDSALKLADPEARVRRDIRDRPDHAAPASSPKDG